MRECTTNCRLAVTSILSQFTSPDCFATQVCVSHRLSGPPPSSQHVVLSLLCIVRLHQEQLVLAFCVCGGGGRQATNKLLSGKFVVFALVWTLSLRFSAQIRDEGNSQTVKFANPAGPKTRSTTKIQKKKMWNSSDNRWY